MAGSDPVAAAGAVPRRVVVTGLGTVNALGRSTAEFAAALRAGACAIAPLTLFDPTGYRSQIAAEVKDVTPPAWLAPALRRRASRADLFALVRHRRSARRQPARDRRRARPCRSLARRHHRRHAARRGVLPRSGRPAGWPAMEGARWSARRSRPAPTSWRRRSASPVRGSRFRRRARRAPMRSVSLSTGSVSDAPMRWWRAAPSRSAARSSPASMRCTRSRSSRAVRSIGVAAA